MKMRPDNEIALGREDARRLSADIAGLDTRVSRVERSLVNNFHAKIVMNTVGATHSSGAGTFQKVGAGAVAGAYTALYDVRPNGYDAQADTTNKMIVIAKAGVYSVKAAVRWSTLGISTLGGVSVYVNGSEKITMYNYVYTAGASSMPIEVSDDLLLAEGDQLELYAYQGDSASEVYYTAVADFNRLAVKYLGAG